MAGDKLILLVEDDPDFREVLAEQLIATGEFEVIEAGNCAEARARATESAIDLAILDVDLPDGDGRDLCRTLCRQGMKCPIIMVTGYHTSDDASIVGLDAGAIDYVNKPFRFSALHARIRAQLRQVEETDHAVLEIGPWSFRPSKKCLADPEDRKVRLTEKETGILKRLYRAGGQVVTREALLFDVWDYRIQSTHTLETHVYRLRQKIEPDPRNPSLLITESGGYRLSL
ncbi:MAG: response regulator transcription factor [Paracoccaceae bacterium]|nr:response regulator transcription factor [Paracoccaceae bacterium]MDE2912278.1 response regulator transcription factor [Paracoccaceae bacterium]